VLKFGLNHLETAVKAAVDLIFAVYDRLKFPGEVRAMERAEWLKQMRDMAEALYDHFLVKKK
jgi:hypothetical protein